MYELLKWPIGAVLIFLITVWTARHHFNDKNVVNEEKFLSVILSKLTLIALVLFFVLVLAFVIVLAINIFVLVVR